MPPRAIGRSMRTRSSRVVPMSGSSSWGAPAFGGADVYEGGAGRRLALDAAIGPFDGGPEGAEGVVACAAWVADAAGWEGAAGVPEAEPPTACDPDGAPDGALGTAPEAASPRCAADTRSTAAAAAASFKSETSETSSTFSS